MGILADKRILITGLLSNRSIAYGVAKSCRQQGAQLAFTYQNERFKDRVIDLAAEFDSSLVFACDVADDAQIEALFADLGRQWDGLDGLVHAIAFAPREAIAGDFLEGLSREGLSVAPEQRDRVADDVSAAVQLLDARRADLSMAARLKAITAPRRCCLRRRRLARARRC